MEHKVVYNACYGGFSLSRIAIDKLIELGSKEAQEELDHYLSIRSENSYFTSKMGANDFLPTLERHDLRLVQVVEELGDEAGGWAAQLKVKIIDSNQYYIDNYDGNETIVTPNSMKDKWIIIS
tara:strand:+ start:5969 stop:6337 length:369 start_codon:yes stop_codon:yes gene_type:complete